MLSFLKRRELLPPPPPVWPAAAPGVRPVGRGSNIDQTRGCEHDLILGGSPKGSFVAYCQPLDTKMEIPIKTFHPFFSTPLPFSEVDSS